MIRPTWVMTVVVNELVSSTMALKFSYRCCVIIVQVQYSRFGNSCPARVLWRFKIQKIPETLSNSNPLPIVIILTLDIHDISYDQPGPETKGRILVIGGRVGD